MITEQGIIDKTIQRFLIDEEDAGWSVIDASCVYWNRDTGAVCGAGNLLSKATLKALKAGDQTASIGNLLARLQVIGRVDDVAMLKKHMTLISKIQRDHDSSATGSLRQVEAGLDEEVHQEDFRERFWYDIRSLIEEYQLDDSLLPSLEVA